MTGIALAASYLIGAIPTAFLVVKWLRQIDVRTVGSGNVGATNVVRVAGFRAGLVVFLIDLAKGLVAVRVIAPLLAGPEPGTMRLACGLAAIIGHCVPVFLAFRGGKGVATTIGVLIGTAPAAALVFLVVWALCYAVWRYVSVGSIAAVATVPVTQALTGSSGPDIVVGGLVACLVIARHHANITRLIRGKEHGAGH